MNYGQRWASDEIPERKATAMDHSRLGELESPSTSTIDVPGRKEKETNHLITKVQSVSRNGLHGAVASSFNQAWHRTELDPSGSVALAYSQHRAEQILVTPTVTIA
ncbi:unnamed protein product [Cylicocyclus nassatus]|uniref:Uncharacterized protein n=1 Tax=Cylicocyclus nassatus TaxID=53992 RepID=A0AA36GN37_CYLNA|nr:unnamed protein product [Cylicocyclus nassatus]